MRIVLQIMHVTAYPVSKLSTDNRVISVDVPRDRAATFEPVLLPKRHTRIPGLDDKLLSLFAKYVRGHFCCIPKNGPSALYDSCH